MSDSSGVELAHSDIIGMRLDLSLRTLQPYALTSVHGTAHPMSAASVRSRSAVDCLIRSAVDISHPRQQENPPASSSVASGLVRNDIINGLGAGAVRGGGNLSLVSSMPPGVVPGPVDSASAPPSLGRGNYLPTQSQTSYHSAYSSPSARRPSSGFGGVNEETDVCECRRCRRACRCPCERCDDPCQ